MNGAFRGLIGGLHGYAGLVKFSKFYRVCILSSFYEGLQEASVGSEASLKEMRPQPLVKEGSSWAPKTLYDS